MKVTYHDFYCLNCGNKSYTLPRKVNKLHGKEHFKGLWCPKCKAMVNHIELNEFDDKETFLQDFQQGKYFDVAAESFIHYMESDVLW